MDVYLLNYNEKHNHIELQVRDVNNPNIIISAIHLTNNLNYGLLTRQINPQINNNYINNISYQFIYCIKEICHFYNDLYGFKYVKDFIKSISLGIHMYNEDIINNKININELKNICSFVNKKVILTYTHYINSNRIIFEVLSYDETEYGRIIIDILTKKISIEGISQLSMSEEEYNIFNDFFDCIRNIFILLNNINDILIFLNVIAIKRDSNSNNPFLPKNIKLENAINMTDLASLCTFALNDMKGLKGLSIISLNSLTDNELNTLMYDKDTGYPNFTQEVSNQLKYLKNLKKISNIELNTLYNKLNNRWRNRYRS